MKWSDLLRRLRALVVWRRVEHELDEELRVHIEMQTRKNVEAVMDAGEAASSRPKKAAAMRAEWGESRRSCKTSAMRFAVSATIRRSPTLQS